LGVAGDVHIGRKGKPESSRFEVYSKKFQIDENGNLTVSGRTSAAELVVTRVLSGLIPSGSFDLGSSTNPWSNVYGTTGAFTNLVVSGSADFAGTTSSSFVINTNNTSSDSEDSYLSFERGTITPNAKIQWDSTNKQFNINQPVKISSASFELVGTASISGDLIIIGSGSFTGQLKVTRDPTQAHTGTWPSFSNTDDATFYINPTSPVADGNIIAYVNGSDPKFVVDAEGDVFIAGNLTLTGTTTQAATDIIGDLTVEGNTTLGDASTDVIKLTGTIRPFSLTSFPLLIKASASQTVDIFRVLDPNDNIVFTIDEGTGLLTASSGFNFALGTSTATVSYSRLGTDTTSHSNYISNFNDLLISGDLEVLGTVSFPGVASISNTLFVEKSGNVGIGTTAPDTIFHVFGANAEISLEDNSTGSKWAFRSEVGGNFSIVDRNAGVNRLTIDTTTGNVGIGDVAIPATGKLVVRGAGLTTGVNFQTRDVDRTPLFTILDNGNVGINKTTPSTVLDVAGTASSSYVIVTNTLHVANAQAATESYSRFGTAITNHGLSVSNDLLISGNLEIDGNFFIDGSSISFGSGASVAGNFDPSVDNTYSLGADDYRWKDLHLGPTSFRISSTTGTSGAGTNYTLASISFSGASLSFGTQSVGSGNGGSLNLITNGNSRLYISQAGNVGIGNTNPQVKLDVEGTLQADTITCESGTCIASTYLSDGGTIGFDWVDAEIADTLTITGGSIAGDIIIDGSIDTSEIDDSTLSIASTQLTDGGTIGFDWIDAEIADTLTITGGSVTSTVLTDGGTIGFDWVDAEIANTLTITAGSIAGDVIVDGSIDTSEIDDSTLSIASTQLTDGGTIGFDWIDGEVADTLTIGASSTVAGDAITDGTIDQTEIADGSIGTGELKTGTGSTSGSLGPNVSADITMNDYSFYPNAQQTTGTNDEFNQMLFDGADDSSTTGRLSIFSVNFTKDYVIRWRYVTASDRPTIWLLLDNGNITSVWQAEDPVKQFEYPANPSPFGEDLPSGQTAVSVSPLSITQLQTLYNSLPVNDRDTILQELREYIVTERQWLNNLNNISDLSQIEERYEPAGRFWAMRHVANYYEIAPSGLILELTTLDTINNQLALKPNVGQVLADHLIQREIRLAENERLQAEQAALPEDQKQADIAEWYTPDQSQILESGDIVSVSPNNGFIVKSAKPYDSNVLGIISTDPKQVIGRKATDDDIKLALTGRVSVKVSLENGQINPGDKLTASSVPGVAMKATEAGITIGIALEKYNANIANAANEVGKILTFVNLSYWAPSETQLTTNNFDELRSDLSLLRSDLNAIMGGTTINIASGSADITTTSTSGLSMPDVLVGLANNVMTKFQNIWATGDIIAEGIKKTYYSVASVFDWEFDLGIMASGWLSREITLAPNVDNETRSLFSGSAVQAADESKLDLEQEDNGAYLATYGVDSTRGEIHLSGSSEISGGEAKIFFDFSFTSIISHDVLLKVLITPTTNVQGQLYVANKTPYGFVVKSINGQGNAKFDWLVIARRRGYEGNDGDKTQSTDGLILTTSPEPQIASSSDLLTENSTEETVASSSEEIITEPIVEQPASASESLITENPTPDVASDSESLTEPTIIEISSTSEPLTQPIESAPTASQSL